MLCVKKGVSIKDFVIPIIINAIEKEEDALLAKKAHERFKKIKDMTPSPAILIVSHQHIDLLNTHLNVDVTKVLTSWGLKESK